MAIIVLEEGLPIQYGVGVKSRFLNGLNELNPSIISPLQLAQRFDLVHPTIMVSFVMSA